jgi:hypothetical protein
MMKEPKEKINLLEKDIRTLEKELRILEKNLHDTEKRDNCSREASTIRDVFLSRRDSWKSN